MHMAVSQVYKSDARTMQKIKALLEKVDITLDQHLDYTCAVFDEEGEPIATGSAFGSTLMGAAVLMGILTSNLNADGAVMKVKETMTVAPAVPSVVTCLANIVAKILPDFLGQNLPLVIGVLSVPLALAFDTDSYFYGMLPVIIAIGQSFGVAALPIAVAMVVCRNCATFISPMVPATLLGTGLADVDIKDHIKASFLYVWVFSILCMIFAVILGILPL